MHFTRFFVHFRQLFRDIFFHILSCYDSQLKKFEEEVDVESNETVPDQSKESLLPGKEVTKEAGHGQDPAPSSKQVIFWLLFWMAK